MIANSNMQRQKLAHTRQKLHLVELQQVRSIQLERLIGMRGEPILMPLASPPRRIPLERSEQQEIRGQRRRFG